MFWEYCSGLFDHWVALMSGVISLAIGIFLRVGHRLGKLSHFSDATDLCFVAIGLICLFIAGYRTWLDEHRALLTERQFNEPKLSATIQSTAIGQPYGQPDETSIVLVIDVMNAGADSIADHWNLAVKIGDDLYSPRPMGLDPTAVVAVMDTSGNRITYSGAQALYNVSVKAPIPRGGKVIGILMYTLPIRHTEAQQGRLQLILTFTDVRGRVLTAENRATDRGGILTYPGLINPPSPAPPKRSDSK